MAKVDITRFVANVQQLFAPYIHEGQTFIAYIDEEDNSYLVKGDNLSFEASGSLGNQVEKLQQNLDALQVAINEMSETLPTSAISIVDDIVYGYDDSSLHPQILTALKGRPILAYRDYGFFLINGNYLVNSNWDNSIQLSDVLPEGNIYAGFGDGKIHTITYSLDEDSFGLTSAPISNGDFIFNKADGNIYVFDADNHAFVRAGGKQHYIVDYIVDYVGYELPATFNARKALFLQVYQDYAECSLQKGDDYYDAYDFSFANIQSILSHEAEIYSVRNSGSSINVIHDLQHGDTIYCNSNGCSYTFINNNGIKSLEAQTTANSGSSIAVVDDIIWGVYDEAEQNPSFPANLKTMRGRPYIHLNDYKYLSVVNFFSSGQLITESYVEEIENAKTYAAFYDGQIYTVDSSGVTSSTPLNNGDFIFNKADNFLYTYDAQNHKFLQEGNHHYVVDRIIDYVNATTGDDEFDNLPNGSEQGALILKADSYGNWSLYYCYLNAAYDGWFSASPSRDRKFCFANIRSGLNNEACIYSYSDNGSGDGYDVIVRVIHELSEGDTFYNKADGCTYTLSVNGNSKSFVRISEPVIPPVQDIVHIGSRLPDSPSEGDKYLEYAPEEINFSGYLFTAPSDSDWGYATRIQNGEFYASLDNHKLYSFNTNKVFMPVSIPVGVPFLNKSDNCLYVFDGSQFVKSTNS